MQESSLDVYTHDSTLLFSKNSGIHLKESMMHSKVHPFVHGAAMPSNYTLAHTAEAMASRTSPTVTSALRTRVLAKTTHWQDWIMRKNGLIA